MVELFSCGAARFLEPGDSRVCDVTRQRDQRILIARPFHCAHRPVTVLHRKKLLSIVHPALNGRVIRATMLIEINSCMREIEYGFSRFNPITEMKDEFQGPWSCCRGVGSRRGADDRRSQICDCVAGLCGGNRKSLRYVPCRIRPEAVPAMLLVMRSRQTATSCREKSKIVFLDEGDLPLVRVPFCAYSCLRLGAPIVDPEKHTC